MYVSAFPPLGGKFSLTFSCQQHSILFIVKSTYLSKNKITIGHLLYMEQKDRHFPLPTFNIESNLHWIRQAMYDAEFGDVRC